MKKKSLEVVLNVLMTVGAFMMGVGIASLLITLLGKIGAMLSVILGLCCVVVYFKLNWASINGGIEK